MRVFFVETDDTYSLSVNTTVIVQSFWRLWHGLDVPPGNHARHLYYVAVAMANAERPFMTQ